MYRRVECHFLRERFGAYLLLAPEEAEAQKIRAHLAVCPACRSALGGYFLLELWEEDGIVPSPDGAGLVRAVMKRLEGGEATPGLSETRISRKKIFSLPLKSEPGLKVSPRRVEALVKSGSPCNPGAKAHDREGNRASRVLWNYLAAAWPPFFFPSGTASKPWPTWPCRAVVYKKGSGPSTVRLDKSSSGVLEKIYSSEISTKGDERMRKNKTWVFVLSFIPGVGHYYLGRLLSRTHATWSPVQPALFRRFGDHRFHSIGRFFSFSPGDLVLQSLRRPPSGRRLRQRGRGAGSAFSFLGKNSFMAFFPGVGSDHPRPIFVPGQRPLS